MSKSNRRKSIFITGAASGIGAATAEYFAQKGWFIGLFDIDEVGLSNMVDKLGADNCHSAVLDVRKQEDWKKAVEGFGKATDGKLRVFFNNAGVGRYGWFEEISEEDSDWIVDVNLNGVIKGIYATLPLLKATKNACIINTASTAGIMGAPRLAVYSATKFAVRGLSDALDVEFKELDIQVKCLMPWFIDTPILDIATREGGNENMKVMIEEQGQTVYPVSLASETVWKAVHSKGNHYMVGRLAERARFMTRWLPGAVKKSLLKGLPSRN